MSVADSENTLDMGFIFLRKIPETSLIPYSNSVLTQCNNPTSTKNIYILKYNKYNYGDYDF